MGLLPILQKDFQNCITTVLHIPDMEGEFEEIYWNRGMVSRLFPFTP